MPLTSGGKFIKHIPCTSSTCSSGKSNRLDSTPAMAVYAQSDGTVDATCFSCGYYDCDPYKDQGIKADTDKVVQADQRASVFSTLTVKQVSECPMRSLSNRGILQSTCEHYGVRTLLNGLDGQTPVATAFPYYKGNKLTGYKKRLIEEKIFTSIGDTKETLLFGQQLYLSGGKKVYITEGEIDALSLYQVIVTNTTLPNWKPAVVSLPHGALNAASALHNNLDFLEKFQEIILCFDQDEAGQEAAEQACSFLPPGKVRVAKFSEKDANDMLVKGKSKELMWGVLSNAKAYAPEGITTSAELATEPYRASERGYAWPWPTLTALTYGIGTNIYCIGAGVGVGKTEWMHEIIWNLTHEQKKPVGVFLLEEIPKRTLQILAGRSLGLPLHKPDQQYNQEDVQSALSEFSRPRELLYFFDHKGSRDWDTIFGQCKYLAAVHGVKVLFIDPLTAIISHEENTDRALHKIMSEMYQLTQDPYNCAVIFSSHLNEPPRDRRPHEEGGRVLESQFAGSRAMIRFSDWIIGLERNKQEGDLIKRNTTTARVLKDREFGTGTGETFELYYDAMVGSYHEKHIEF